MKKPDTHQRKRMLALAVACAIGATMTSPARASGIPTLPGDIAFNAGSYMEDIEQTIVQAEQYGTQLQQYINQLQQYELMVKNAAAPLVYVWDKANSLVNKVMGMTSIVDQYKNKFNNLDGYLNKFQDINYYRNSPCFSKSGCSETEWKVFEESRALGSEGIKKANDAMFKMLDAQQESLAEDARNLEKIQRNAQDADGQLKALAAANQLAANQAHQLMQIRALLIAQHNALAAIQQNAANIDAQQEAASAALRESRYKKSNARPITF